MDFKAEIVKLNQDYAKINQRKKDLEALIIPELAEDFERIGLKHKLQFDYKIYIAENLDKKCYALWIDINSITIQGYRCKSRENTAVLAPLLKSDFVELRKKYPVNIRYKSARKDNAVFNYSYKV